MAHYAKYTRASVGGLTKHYERAKGENGEYLRFKNEEIDLLRSHLNYNLAPHQKDQREFINERLLDVYCLKRDDVKVMCDWVVTVPKSLPEKYHREFFERTYQFLAEKYGEKNVVSAHVHMDETTPHMHFAFIPVVYDPKKDREKVSAKEAVTREDLRTFHTELQAVMDAFVAEHDYEFECDVLNGATDNGNLTVQGLKAGTLEEQNQQTEAVLDELIEQTNDVAVELQELHREREKLTAEVARMERVKSGLEDEIVSLEERIEEIKSSKLGMIEQFLKNPKIGALFEEFCRKASELIERRKTEREERKAERGSLSWKEYGTELAEERKNKPTVGGSEVEKSGKRKKDPNRD